MTSLRIGIVCYPTYGGSGVVATEIGMGMARRGHRVHFIAAGVPRRLDRYQANVFFHEVEMRDYPVFVSPPYAIGLASKIVEVSTYEKLDVLHVHYAVPHATSAYLAKQVLGVGAPKIITTLHGTDITLVGNDRSYLPITRFSIIESDGVTTPSTYLKLATYDKLNVSSTLPIEVIANFVDVEMYKPGEHRVGPTLSPCFQKLDADEPVLVHVSNFRAVKRIPDIIDIFERVNRQLPARLILIGDGPERSAVERLVWEKQLTERVRFLGKLESFVELLQESCLFLLPSESESFGLAALEAMSCGLPVVASNAGGIPEVVQHGVTGYLSDIGDTAEMAANALTVLKSPELYSQMSNASRQRAVQNFSASGLLSRYEDYYRAVLAKP
jgi:L-malate glycosyltransferase